MKELVPIGTLGEPHGHSGKIKVYPLNGEIKKIQPEDRIYLINNKDKVLPVKIEQISQYCRNRYLVKLYGFQNRKQVENLKKYTIAVSV